MCRVQLRARVEEAGRVAAVIARCRAGISGMLEGDGEDEDEGVWDEPERDDEGGGGGDGAARGPVGEGGVFAQFGGGGL